MIDDTEKEYDIEPFAERSYVIDRHLGELDLDADRLCSEPRLAQIIGVEIDRENASGTSQFHLNRIEAGVATNVENGFAGEIGCDRVRKTPPFHRRVITEKMVGGGHHPAEINVVEPRSERRGGIPERV